MRNIVPLVGKIPCMIKALIFDFDGLILDTETPEVRVWESIYGEYGHEFPSEQWGQIIGGYGLSDFDPAEDLAHLTQGQLNAVSLRARHRLESDSLTLSEPILPGVLNLIHEAKRMGLKLAIASSATHDWVDTHAKRLGIFDYFDKIVCADDVAPGRTKPHPDLFLLALSQLKVQKNEAIVFEDSPNGVNSARSAGIFVVAVPNPVTSLLQLEGESLRLKSLTQISLSDLLARFDGK
jgi:HAD superfamily hydrolase (TIGR01509 family)